MKTPRSPFALLRRRAGLGAILLLAAFAAGLAAPRSVAAPPPIDGNEVVIVFNKKFPGSREVAEYYAEKRKVRQGQMIGLDVVTTEHISRADYTNQIQNALLAELKRRKLAEFVVEPYSPNPSQPPRQAQRCTSAKFRYLLLCYGLPWRIAPDPTLIEPGATPGVPQMSRNEASVDSELMLLPVLGRFPVRGVAYNVMLGVTNTAALQPTNGVFLVTRLDGATPALAKGLVDKALVAEQEGLCGNAYFDLRNITAGPYKTGDDWITNAATVAKRLGYSTYVDNKDATFEPTLPLSQVAVYAGWYTPIANGPFARPEVEFMPGAIAYHIHSYSGSTLRVTNQAWTGALIGHGATVSLGAVDEPYLNLTPNIGLFLELLAFHRYTVGEAGCASQPVLSWQNVVIGDPLYRPFGRNLLELEEDLNKSAGRTVDWVLLRKVNIMLALGKEPGPLRQFLVEQPVSATSAVLCEKIAAMSADLKLTDDAITWGRRALLLKPTLQQRTRLRLNLGEWLKSAGRAPEALGVLLDVEKERSDYAALAGFRQQLLALAREAGDAAAVARLSGPAPAATDAPKQ